VFEVWPNNLHTWFAARDPKYAGLPETALLPDSMIDRSRNRPRILSPAEGFEYLLATGVTSPQRLPLEAYGAYDTDGLFWFVDGQFLDRSDVGRKLFWPMRPGKHRFTCVDRHSRSTSVTVLFR